MYQEQNLTENDNKSDDLSIVSLDIQNENENQMTILLPKNIQSNSEEAKKHSNYRRICKTLSEAISLLNNTIG